MNKPKVEETISPMDEAREKLAAIGQQINTHSEDEYALLDRLKEASQLEAGARADVLIDSNDVSKKAHSKAQRAFHSVTRKLEEHRQNLAALKTAQKQLQERMDAYKKDRDERNRARVSEHITPRWDSLVLSAQAALAELCVASALKSDTPLAGVNPVAMCQVVVSEDEYREAFRKTLAEVNARVKSELGLES